MFAVYMSASLFFFCTAAFLGSFVGVSFLFIVSHVMFSCVGFEVCASKCFFFLFFLVWAHLHLLMMIEWFLPVLRCTVVNNACCL